MLNRVIGIEMPNACPTAIDFYAYQLRNPKASGYYRCVENHFEQLEAVRDGRYQPRPGYWRPFGTHVIQRHLDWGDLHFGFARVTCTVRDPAEHRLLLNQSG